MFDLEVRTLFYVCVANFVITDCDVKMSAFKSIVNITVVLYLFIIK